MFGFVGNNAENNFVFDQYLHISMCNNWKWIVIQFVCIINKTKILQKIKTLQTGVRNELLFDLDV